LLAGCTLIFPFLQAVIGVIIPLAVVGAIVIKLPILLTLMSFLPLAIVLIILVVEAVGLSEFCRDYGFRARPYDYARLVVGFVPYQVVLSYAAVGAIVRECVGRRSWVKTAHLGLHFEPEGAEADAA
jgi:hypothetical protein